VFDEDRDEWAQARAELRDLVGEDGYAAARRTTINAHYTDPAIVAAIWQLVQDLGFDGGRVLEPGCGIGTFIGLAPAGAELTGVELDPATARLAQALYPHATVRGESFADTRLPDGFFDLTVGNVPFADVKLHDPQHNPGRHSIHNHFILKSLALTRPGGLVAVLSSRFTLDAANPAARREMSALADLVGAVRLPSGSHRRAAGTEAVMDLLVFRRRRDGEAPADLDWESTRAVTVDGQQVRVNSWLAHRPAMILGTLSAARGMYASDTLLVRPDAPLEQTAERLRAAAGELVAFAREHGLSAGERDTSPPAAERQVALAPVGEWDGHIVAEPDGRFAVVAGGVQTPLSVPGTQAAELRALLGLRDAARGLLAAEAATIEDTPELALMRVQLRDHYTAYVELYGPLNRYTLRRTGRADPDSGEERMARITPPAVRLLCQNDPFGPLVRALENFDHTSQTAAPAALLSERVVAPRAPRLGADTPQDALAICLDTHARVELGEIARLLGTSEREAREQLGELVYHDPAADRLLTAAEYLSGDVRVKLEQARAAAARDTSLAVNVQALERVLPPDLGPEEITPRLGAAWIDADTHPPVPLRAPRGPRRRGRAPGRSDLGGQGPRLHRQGQPASGAPAGWTRFRSPKRRWSSAGHPGDRRDRRGRSHQARPERDRDRRRAGKGRRAAGALRRVVLGGPGAGRAPGPSEVPVVSARRYYWPRLPNAERDRLRAPLGALALELDGEPLVQGNVVADQLCDRCDRRVAAGSVWRLSASDG
jgi:SAM-dependent methyltransferase